MKFKKKPIEIEAVRFTGDNWAEMHEFTGHHASSGNDWPIDTFNPAGTYTLTYTLFSDAAVRAEVWDRLHSTWVGVKGGQWIICGTEGEYYPCADDGTGTAPLNYDPA